MFCLLKNVQAVKGVSIAKASFSLFAWFLFCIFVSDDQTYESLEKRDFDLLDDIAFEKPITVAESQPPPQPTNIAIKDDKPTAINMNQKF